MSRGRGAGAGRGRGTGRGIVATLPAGVAFEDVIAASKTRDPTPLYPVGSSSLGFKSTLTATGHLVTVSPFRISPPSLISQTARGRYANTRWASPTD